jgi:putative SOS response-associated peptidase YedK
MATGPPPNVRPHYNAAPKQQLLVVLRDPETGDRRLETMRCGIIPIWAKDAESHDSIINAMAETVATARVFRDAFKSRRCLVAADGFYAWKKLDAKTMQPYRFAMTDGAPFAFAGLWERCKEPASGKMVRSFAIITTTPNALCSPLHNRMPVILDAGDYQTWLGEAPASGDELQALLCPFPADLMDVHMIGPRIDDVKNDDAALIERLNSA